MNNQPDAQSLARWIDLGDNHSMRFLEFEGDAKSAFEYKHFRPDGTECIGHISITGAAWAQAFNNKIETWDVQSWEPFTCTPSLLCRVCGDHGFITDGKWVKA